MPGMISPNHMRDEALSLGYIVGCNQFLKKKEKDVSWPGPSTGENHSVSSRQLFTSQPT